MMNADIDGSPAMVQDAAMAQCSGYGTDSWVSISPYGHSPYDNGPMSDYAGFGQFVPHELPETMSSGSSRMPPPQPDQLHPHHNNHHHHHHHHHHHQLIQPAPAPMAHHQLPMLNTAWPSQLTNPTPTSSAASYSAPPLPIAPVSSGPPATPAPPPAVVAPAAPAQGPRPTQATDGPKPQGPPEKVPRKTLSAEQKRAMCQYHDENPGTRQADIGAKFGVERSTVSKVLRHRDQYLKREQDADFALKRGKGKHPDFDRTLSNYIRRQQQRGFDVKDEIMEQAKLFARASGNQEGLVGSLTSSWLHKFKQKHGIGSGRLMRRASETNIPDSARLSTALAGDGAAAAGVSPVSPTQPLSPLSGTRSDDDVHRDALDLDFTYRAHGSQSNTPLASDARDKAVSSSFSPDTLSPTAPSFAFSPDAFAVDQAAPLHHHHREKRSNTFPSIDVSFASQEPPPPPPPPEPTMPRLRPAPAVTSAPSSAVQSPASDSLRAAPLALNTALTSSPPPRRRTSSSNSSVTARSSAEASPVPAPTHEEARQAANTLLSYIQRMRANGHFDQSEYLAVVQLTKKLQIHHHNHHHYHHHQAARPSLGGLLRIPEGDHEMPPPPPETMMEVR